MHIINNYNIYNLLNTIRVYEYIRNDLIWGLFSKFASNKCKNNNYKNIKYNTTIRLVFKFMLSNTFFNMQNMKV